MTVQSWALAAADAMPVLSPDTVKACFRACLDSGGPVIDMY